MHNSQKCHQRINSGDQNPPICKSQATAHTMIRCKKKKKKRHLLRSFSPTFPSRRAYGSSSLTKDRAARRAARELWLCPAVLSKAAASFRSWIGTDDN
ncbi:hypothetical protein ILYODFUR_023119 [Ilyodon furcidens]|uniref:Uncharacterized protein n=1 Tax=Ilyodon furcidens TaxID=33524 RepID=A0ABV0UJX8_9TELE